MLETLCAMETPFTVGKILASSGNLTRDRYISKPAPSPLSYRGSSGHCSADNTRYCEHSTECLPYMYNISQLKMQ
ncbi:MAG: hypothetical protein AB2693_29715 [Candidatus Thiodiazotropha sp.]